MQALEGRVLMSLEACDCNLRASAPHSCESRRFVVEVQRDTLPSPMCQIFPWALDKKPKQDGLGTPAHVILHQIHVKCFWPQSWALQISIWDKWTRAHSEPDWLSPLHIASPSLLSGTAEDHRACWEEIDNNLNLEMSVTWVSFSSVKKRGGKRSQMSKRENRTKRSSS